MKYATLITDLGLKDGKAGIAKAILHQAMPQTTIVDLTHEIERFDLQQAAYVLLSCYTHFPPGTCHIVLADMYANSADGNTKPLKSPGPARFILGEAHGHYFITPDNGLITLAFGGLPIRVWQVFEAATIAEAMAKAGALISTLPHIAGLVETTSFVRKQRRMPQIVADGIEANVLYVDRYGNVVLNITKRLFEAAIGNEPFRIAVPHKKAIAKLSSHYSEVSDHEPLCRFNSTGFLSLAINHHSAAERYGLNLLNSRQLYYHTVKIHCDTINEEAHTSLNEELAANVKGSAPFNASISL